MKRKQTRELQLLSPDRAKHGEGLYDLLGKVFSDGGYYRFRDACRDSYIGDSHYDWSASQIGILGGRIVTHYGVWGYDMRIGTSVVRAGGIGAVATDADYRKRGLMAKTVVASLDAMRRCGYDMTILFGIADFYDKFGYVRAWSRVFDSIGVERLPKGRPTVRPKRFADMTREDVTAIYTREHRELTGTAVRPTYGKTGRGWLKWVGWRWEDARGRTAGYVVTAQREQALECYEVGGDAEEALRVLAMLTRRQSCRELKFVDLHERTPMIRMIRLGDCTTTAHHRRNGGPMIRIINLTSSLTKMCGELSRRLRRSHLADWRGKLLIADRREKRFDGLTAPSSVEGVTLSIADGRVSVAKPSKIRHAIRGGEEIAQLLIGTAEPHETVRAGRIRLRGDAAKLLPVLFPAQQPRLCPWDGY